MKPLDHEDQDIVRIALINRIGWARLELQGCCVAFFAHRNMMGNSYGESHEQRSDVARFNAKVDEIQRLARIIKDLDFSLFGTVGV